MTQYVLNSSNADQSYSSDHGELFEVFVASTQELDLTPEQRSKWFQEIKLDLRTRHTGIREPWDHITHAVSNHINLQLSTFKINLYTLIPVSGLSVSMDFIERLKITEQAIVRKIDRRELPQFTLQTLNIRANDFPSIGLEYCRVVSAADLQNHYNDDDYLRRVLEGDQNAATSLQLIVSQGVHFPWLIQYVPECQFPDNLGKWNIAWFNQSSSQNLILTY